MKERAEEVCQSSAGHTDEEDFFLTNSKRQPPHDASAGQIGNVLTVCVRACVRACVRVCVCAQMPPEGPDVAGSGTEWRLGVWLGCPISSSEKLEL